MCLVNSHLYSGGVSGSAILIQYATISMFIISFVTDKIIHGFSRRKLLFIITEKEEEVCKHINANMQRDATFLNGESLSGDKRKIIHCMVQLAHLPELKYRVLMIDPNYFGC